MFTILKRFKRESTRHCLFASIQKKNFLYCQSMVCCLARLSTHDVHLFVCWSHKRNMYFPLFFLSQISTKNKVNITLRSRKQSKPLVIHFRMSYFNFRFIRMSQSCFSNFVSSFYHILWCFFFLHFDELPTNVSNVVCGKCQVTTQEPCYYSFTYEWRGW